METKKPATKKPIPILDLQGEVKELWKELKPAVEGVLKSGAFILGPEVQQFEAECAAYLDVKHAIGVNSGTDAIVLGLRGMGIGPGDEVITSSFSFFATAECIELVGAKAVFVDIDPRTFNIDTSQIEAKITPRTKAIVPVHLFGQAADMGPIVQLAKRHNLRILEDTAQAWGGEYNSRKLGAIGDVGTYSFYPTKNLGGYGDGGLLTTNDDEVARTVRILRDHGSAKKYHHVMLGYNSRLDSLQAAVLRIKLRRIDAWNSQRRNAAALYTKLLAGVRGLTPPHEASYGRHVYHQYTVRIHNGRRDEVKDALQAEGISSVIYYPEAMHRAPYFDARAREAGDAWAQPQSEMASGEVLSLPIGPRLKDADIKRVARTIRRALKKKS